ncbi:MULTISPECIES: NAD-dependent epimerase/dehydratase family protein [unclassified Janthinobacterium]|uniref:NAD-dependent epimerase/dehydratase family protein n=1 Tax=unclassified Janthinobacterium TaxID=2610881 RepID=UPI00034699EA|nr:MULTISPECIES: NAD(P)-dependent oxidoreductase [unclassified Janthinobacterium]
MTDANRYLVTGGSGFIGTNLVERLLQDGCTVLSVDAKAPANPAHGAVFRNVDLLDYPAMEAVLREFQPTHVYHLGARTDLLGATLADYAANTDGVANVIRATRACPSVRRVLFCSSRLVCKIGYPPSGPLDFCPTTPYGESKVKGEMLVREAGITEYSWALVRPTSLWGPWFGVPYRTFFEQVKRRRYVHPAGKVVRKSFGYVGNSVFQLRALMAGAAAVVQGQVFYIGDYEPIEVNTFANAISAAFDGPAVRQVPPLLLSGAALLGDALAKCGYTHPPLTTFRLNNILTEMIHDFDNLKAITGPLPFSNGEAIRTTVAWIKAHG